MLRTLIEEMRDKIKRTGINSLYSRRSRCAEAAEEHAHILAALERHDAQAAGQAMEKHLDIHIFCNGHLLKKKKGDCPSPKVFDRYER